jgi:hypothetical protein
MQYKNLAHFFNMISHFLIDESFVDVFFYAFFGAFFAPWQQQSPTWKEQQSGDENLVGCAIKIWWPVD